MDTVLVAATRNAELHALGTGGQLAVLAWDQIAQYLRRALSPAHGRLFAEPNFDPERGVVDWYTEGREPPRRLAELDPAERGAVEARLATLLAEIQAESEKLRGSARESDRFMGETLALALEVPDAESSVYVADGQPVLVGWGHLREGAGAARGQLMRFVRPAAVPMAIVRHVPGPPPARALWPVWLLALALLLLFLLLLLGWWFRPYIVAWLGLEAPVCRVTDAQIAVMTRLDEERARETALRNELADVVGALGLKRVNCPVPVPPPAPEPPPQQRAETPPPATPMPKPEPPPRAPEQPPEDDLQRVKERGGQEGNLQVTLAWDDRNDLDVYVMCPSGEEINWRAANRERCGGKLDIDANNGRGPLIGNPVENVFWDNPPAGHYRIAVQNYKPNGSRESPYRITIRQKGKPDRVVRGVARAGEPPRLVAELDVP